MERVVTLSNKLQDQLNNNASIEQLLTTVDMLQSELVHLKLIQPKTAEPQRVVINIAGNERPTRPTQQQEKAIEEKIVEILQVDEAAVEAELDEIKRNAQSKNNLGVHNKPAIVFDPLEEIPTLVNQPSPKLPTAAKVANIQPEQQQPALHESIAAAATVSSSLNEKLKQTNLELGETLLETPIKDLKKAIGINDRFLFINELFRGDDVMYERSIKTINSFSIFPEAEYWIKRELKLKLGWDDKNEVVKQFDQLVKRRFS